MRIVITDSGVGGLSVCAYAERYVRENGFTEPVHLTFANAAPANDYGYNSMPSHEVKLETFDRFLTNVTERYKPDLIYVACNTLSVLLPDTAFVNRACHPERQRGTWADGRRGTHAFGPVADPRGDTFDTPIPVKGIVATAVDLLVRELQSDPRSIAIVFGTQTTIDSGVYPHMLQQRGIAPERVISQACPALADTISEDREGTKTRSEIARWVRVAIEKMRSTDVPVVAALACTHYGYRKKQFAAALAENGVGATVINPNERAVDDLFETTGGSHEVDVEFVTRYAIPAATIEALTWFLNDISPRTVLAMKNFVHVPELF